MYYPPLRFIEAVRIEHEGEQLVLIRDPEHLCEEPIVVTLPMFLIMSQLDGQSGGREIQTWLMRATQGQIVPVEQIDKVIAQLDAFYLLNNERSARRRAELEADFDQALVRAPSHVGQAYPVELDGLRAQLEGWFGSETCETGAPRPRGLITPHIDLRVGGECIARTFARLPVCASRRLYIILGVAHQPTRNLFTLTDKSFASPLGVARTDRAAVELLRDTYGATRLDGQYVHKHEHSIEFQILFLQHLHHGREEEFQILPILCGSMHEYYEEDHRSALVDPRVGDFVGALRRLSNEYDGEVCIVAGVDLSHVGRKFGQDEGVDDFLAERVRQADRAMLAHVEAMDPEGFLDHFRPDANSRNVDGVSAIYVMLHALGAGRGELIDYRQWRETATDSMVTFAGMAIY